MKSKFNDEMAIKGYTNWEAAQDFSPISPEAYHAEQAWFAALTWAKEQGLIG